MDICAGLVGCLLTVIIFIFVAPCIYIASPGPIFFSQVRVGQNGKKFKMYKFRSMYLDAEERKKDLMDQNKVSDGRMFKMDFDPRIIGNKILPDGTHKTGIGEFIRKTSLDEFPQFFNVLKGDMSLVGTRPPTVDETKLYDLHHYARLAIKPGITGMWQISGRSDITDFEEVVRLDKEYIERWNPGLDVKILLNIFTIILTSLNNVIVDTKRFFMWLNRKGRGKMIITQTPFRMSFFGGGTDMESFFRKYGGAVLSTTFDKYCYVNVRHLPRFFDYSTELSYSRTERVASVEDIEHPAIRNAMKMLDMHEIRLTYEADLPARSGLGTSSSFAVGMLNAFYALKGKYADKKKLADEAIYLERVLCEEAGGWQDQIAASFGGFNRINFNTDGTYDVLPVIISPERKKNLNDNLMMFFTGFTRFSSDVQKANAGTKETQEAKEKRYLEMLSLVDKAEQILTDKNTDLDNFGRLLDHTWKLKKQTGSAVSTNSIDALYEKGMQAGALGGKLLGAGGGGFLVFYVQPEYQEAVKEAMKELMYIPFRFEDGGTRVIHYTPETYVPLEDK